MKVRFGKTCIENNIFFHVYSHVNELWILIGVIPVFVLKVILKYFTRVSTRKIPKLFDVIIIRILNLKEVPCNDWRNASYQNLFYDKEN